MQSVQGQNFPATLALLQELERVADLTGDIVAVLDGQRLVGFYLSPRGAAAAMSHYVLTQPAPKRCTKCGARTDERPRSKYCGDGTDKDNQHNWVAVVDD